MTSEVFTQTVGPGNDATFTRGRIFNILSATGPVNIQLEYRGLTSGNQTDIKRLKGLPPGCKFKSELSDPDWTYLRLQSTIVQSVTIFIGDDDIEFNQAVTVTGVAITQENPATTLTDQSPINAPNAAQTAIFTAGARRRIRVSVPSNSAIVTFGAIFFRTAGGANNLMELQVGLIYEFDGTYGVDVRNDSGIALTVMKFEES